MLMKVIKNLRANGGIGREKVQRSQYIALSFNNITLFLTISSNVYPLTRIDSTRTVKFSIKLINAVLPGQIPMWYIIKNTLIYPLPVTPLY